MVARIGLMQARRAMSTAKPELVSSNKMFGGLTTRHRHQADTLGCEMGFAVYTPPMDKAVNGQFSVLYWLSGLTCDDTNFITKAGSQKYLAEHGIMVVCPDTSPRGLDLPGQDDSYDFGSAAGFYLNATQDPWATNYRMEEYVTQELRTYISEHFPINEAATGIFGHSMGGLGALNLFLKNRDIYKSASAFAPICHPTTCPWGQKAFKGYLGEDETAWKEYDPVLLLEQTDLDTMPPILVSQGGADDFLTEQLKPETLPSHPNVVVEMHEGYDHSYYFMASFIEQHIQHHAAILSNNP
eukprot:m.137135 g.137135  ORF g.137135 m.137135 type:complete len:298 (+) comp16042_c0_seq6:68-961(+)